MATIEPTKLRTFGRNLAVCLALIKKTTAELSVETGITERRLESLEHGQGRLKAEDLLRIADELNISVLCLTKTYGGDEQRRERLAETLAEAGHMVHFKPSVQSDVEASPYMKRPEPGRIVKVLPNGSILSIPARKERQPGRYKKTKNIDQVAKSK
jgi:transcriptional regulator with XRE-family HTH domain